MGQRDDVLGVGGGTVRMGRCEVVEIGGVGLRAGRDLVGAEGEEGFVVVVVGA